MFSITGTNNATCVFGEETQDYVPSGGNDQRAGDMFSITGTNNATCAFGEETQDYVPSGGNDQRAGVAKYVLAGLPQAQERQATFKQWRKFIPEVNDDMLSGRWAVGKSRNLTI